MKNARSVVRACYDALDSGDREAAFALLDDDSELVQADSLPSGGTWRGREGIADFFERLSET